MHGNQNVLHPAPGQLTLIFPFKNMDRTYYFPHYSSELSNNKMSSQEVDNFLFEVNTLFKRKGQTLSKFGKCLLIASIPFCILFGISSVTGNAIFCLILLALYCLAFCIIFIME